MERRFIYVPSHARLSLIRTLLSTDTSTNSKNRNDNHDSPNDDGIVYGNDIQTHVKKFYNLFDHNDDLLRFGPVSIHILSNIRR
ncbi:MAG TPA: hypothetical protein VFD60_04395 [Nitrososphaeraceae archaeon]|jgi:Mg2+ and Co2+ transporter CorA|nr:hypothetical protein [Nitrososphaeraceae archaeon]